MPTWQDSRRRETSNGPTGLRRRAARLQHVDGILDWYLLGVVFGLGLVAGVGMAGAAKRRVWALVTLAADALGVALVLLALPAWALIALLAAGMVGFFSLRRLSPEALPAAVVAGVALAVIPALGYVAAAIAPVAGERLGRRASARYAGLRVLAKD